MRDTAVVIFSVAVGVAAEQNLFTVAVGIVVLGIAIELLHRILHRKNAPALTATLLDSQFSRRPRSSSAVADDARTPMPLSAPAASAVFCNDPIPVIDGFPRNQGTGLRARLVSPIENEPTPRLEDSMPRNGFCFVALFVIGFGSLSLSESAFADGTDLDFEGVSIPGETFVFCLDRSASMAWGGNFPLMQHAIELALLDLEPTQSFSLVVYGNPVESLSASPIPATAANVASGIAWTQGINPIGSTCIAPGVIEGLSIAAQGPAPTLLIIGDGAPNCAASADSVSDVVGANTQQIPIHTFFAPMSFVDLRTQQFLSSLASENGGEFFDLSLPLPLPFIRGDANSDGGVDIADAITILLAGFGQTSSQCLRAHDANGDGVVTAVADAISLLAFVFQGGPPPPGPFPECGTSVGAIDDCDTPLPCP